ncbi:MAG: HipA N-terminal domain-containing protein, partial [Burkholderiaceae bacterium]|nr:HipA N-terminal domain-containing protein [Burkholderiaceae bacterium]
MKLDVQVCNRTVAKLYRESDEYVLSYPPDADPADFVSLTMPVRAEPWRWPRDLHPFFRQNLPEFFANDAQQIAFGQI